MHVEHALQRSIEVIAPLFRGIVRIDGHPGEDLAVQFLHAAANDRGDAVPFGDFHGRFTCAGEIAVQYAQIRFLVQRADELA